MNELEWWMNEIKIQCHKNESKSIQINGTASFNNVNFCLNTNIHYYLETSGGQSSNLYLNAVGSFNASVN